MFLAWFLYSTGYVLAAIVILLVAKKLFDLLTPYSVEAQLAERDNPAVGVLMAGYFAGVSAIICGLAAGETPSPSLTIFLGELREVFLYGVLGMILLFIAGIVNDRVILCRFSNEKEIISRQNTAVALVMGAGFLASGIIIGAGIYASRGVVSAVLSFILAQGLLVGFAAVYHRVTQYDDQTELGERRNLAAALGHAGSMVAFSLVVAKGLADVGEDWGMVSRVLNVLYYAVAGCALLVAARTICDKVFLPSSDFSREIVRDRNVNAGLLEGTLALGLGAILVCCL